MAGINDQLANLVLKQAVRVRQFSGVINLQVQGNLVELERDLARQIDDADLAATRTSRQELRLKELRADVNKSITTTYVNNNATLNSGLMDIAVLQQTAFVVGANKIFTADIIGVTMTNQELRVLTRGPIVLGHPARAHWLKQSQNLRFKFVGEMRLGIAGGETNDQLVDRIIGTKTGQKKTVEINGVKKRVPVRTNGIMDVSRREATSLVRTSAQSVSNTVLGETYRGNSDVIKGIAVLVTLDGRTTKICMSLSGGVWDIQTGEPLPESAVTIDYPGEPPYHFQCRTVASPVTKSWEELGSKTKTKIDTAPTSARASMNGEVPGKLTYESWLTMQPKKFQVDQLGRGRWELWDKGKINLNQLTDNTLRPLTLVELKELI